MANQYVDRCRRWAVRLLVRACGGVPHESVVKMKRWAAVAAAAVPTVWASIAQSATYPFYYVQM